MMTLSFKILEKSENNWTRTQHGQWKTNHTLAKHVCTKSGLAEKNDESVAAATKENLNDLRITNENRLIKQLQSMQQRDCLKQ
mgnify:FL=1